MAFGKPTLLRYILYISLLLNLVCAVYIVRRLVLRSKIPAYTPPPRLPYYLSRDKLFEAIPVDSNAIVFLGNSLTQYFELAELLPGFNVKNRGIHGEVLEKTLQRLGPVIQSKPKKIFIELGINDVEEQRPLPKLLALYSRLLDTLKASCPNTQLYVQSLLPVADTSRYLPTYCSPRTNKTINTVNLELEKLAREKGCTYINLHKHFLTDGQINSKYTVDGVHISGEGYLLWASLIKPFLAQKELLNNE